MVGVRVVFGWELQAGRLPHFDVVLVAAQRLHCRACRAGGPAWMLASLPEARRLVTRATVRVPSWSVGPARDPQSRLALTDIFASGIALISPAPSFGRPCRSEILTDPLSGLKAAAERHPDRPCASLQERPPLGSGQILGLPPLETLGPFVRRGSPIVRPQYGPAGTLVAPIWGLPPPQWPFLGSQANRSGRTLVPSAWCSGGSGSGAPRPLWLLEH